MLGTEPRQGSLQQGWLQFRGQARIRSYLENATKNLSTREEGRSEPDQCRVTSRGVYTGRQYVKSEGNLSRVRVKNKPEK